MGAEGARRIASRPNALADTLPSCAPKARLRFNAERFGDAAGDFFVVWDYVSLPQRASDGPPRDSTPTPSGVRCWRRQRRHAAGSDDRSEAQRQAAAQAARALHVFFAAPSLTKLLLTRLPAELSSYGNQQPFDARAWKQAERALCGLATEPRLLLDCGMLAQGDMATADWPVRRTRPRTFPRGSGALLLLRAACSPTRHACDRRAKLVHQCEATRPPPLPPPAFEQQLAAGLASGATILGGGAVASSLDELDVDGVHEQYELGFLQMRTLGELRFSGLGWGDAQAETLAAALAYAIAHGGGSVALERLMLHDNHIGDRGAAALARVLAEGKERLPALREVTLDGNCIGAAGARAVCEALGASVAHGLDAQRAGAAAVRQPEDASAAGVGDEPGSPPCGESVLTAPNAPTPFVPRAHWSPGHCA